MISATLYPVASIRALIWKEARQLLPIAVVLATVSMFLIAATLLFESETAALQFIPRVLRTAIPELSAIAIGLISVSDEKERSTLRWLSTLPIPASTIWITKFAVGLAMLVLVIGSFHLSLAVLFSIG